MKRVLVSVAWIAVALVPLLTAHWLGFDTKRLTRDISAEASLPFWTGWVSTLGGMLWAAAAATCLTASLVAHELRLPRQQVGFMAGMGVLLAYLGLDDSLVIHDGLVYEWLDSSESAYYLLFVAPLLLFAWRFRIEFLKSDPGTLVLAAVLLAASLLEDLVRLLPAAAEDAAKLAGIGLLVIWSCSQAVATVRLAPMRAD